MTKVLYLFKIGLNPAHCVSTDTNECYLIGNNLSWKFFKIHNGIRKLQSVSTLEWKKDQKLLDMKNDLEEKENQWLANPSTDNLQQYESSAMKINKLEGNLMKNSSKQVLSLYQKIGKISTKLQTITGQFFAASTATVIYPKFNERGSLGQKGIYCLTIGKLTRIGRTILNNFKHMDTRKKVIFLRSKTGGRVVDKSEAFSSCTCRICLRVNCSTKRKLFICAFCGHEEHRDVHAAKFILLHTWIQVLNSTLKKCKLLNYFLTSL